MRWTYLLLLISIFNIQCDLFTMDDRVNAIDEGVVKCTPGAKICRGNQVLQCNSNGKGQTILEVCAGGYTCESGACNSPTDASQDTAVGPAILSLDPASYDFGEVFVSNRATQAFILKNSGGSTATTVSINPMIDDVFSVEVESTTCTSPTLAPNNSCIITVVFHPNAEGSASGSVTLTYHSGVAEETLIGELSGTGTTGVVLTITGDGDFGEQPISGRISRVFTITQAGTIAATNLSVGGLAAPFIIHTTDCPATLSGLCTVTIQFSPENKDEAADTLEVSYHNGQEMTSAIKELSGQGVPPYGWIGKTVSNQLVHPWSSDPITPLNFAIGGTEPGAFQDIYGMTFDSAGNIYVVEQANCRVQRFDSNGNPTGWIGSNGSVNTGWQMGNDPRCLPYGESVFGFGQSLQVSQANGMLFILDNTNGETFPYKIQQWDLNGNRVALHNLSPAGGYFLGMLTLDPSNYFFLSVPWLHRVERWYFNGSSLEYAGFIGGIVSYHNTSGWRAAYNGTEYEDTAFASGAAGTIVEPEDLVIDEQGVVYILDRGPGRITRLWANGSFAGSICGVTDGWDWENCSWGSSGYFSNPFSLTLWNGSLLVADTNNHRIRRFNGVTGQYWDGFGSSGSGDGGFSYPSGIAADRNGALYIADTANYRVQKWLFNGTNDSFDYIGWIGYDGSTGDYHRDFLQGGYGNTPPDSYNKSGFYNPAGVAVDEDYLYVVDQVKYSVQRFWLADPAQVDQLILTTGTNSPSPMKIEVTPTALYVTAYYTYDIRGSTIVYLIDKESFSVSRVFDPNAIFGQSPLGGRIFGPHSIRVYNGLCYLAEYYQPQDNIIGGELHARISRATLDLNTLIDWAGHYKNIVPTSGWTMNGDTGYGKLPGAFKLPVGLAIDPVTGLLYVADTLNNRVQQFPWAGTFQSQDEVTFPLYMALADDAIFVTSLDLLEMSSLLITSITKYDYDFTPLGKIRFDFANDIMPYLAIATLGNYLYFGSSSLDFIGGHYAPGARLFRWHQAAMPGW